MVRGKGLGLEDIQSDPRDLTRLQRLGYLGRTRCLGPWPAGQRLADAHQQRAVQRSRGTADLHHQGHARLLERRTQGHRFELGCERCHRVESAAQVGAMVAVADCPVEEGGENAGGIESGQATPVNGAVGSDKRRR